MKPFQVKRCFWWNGDFSAPSLPERRRCSVQGRISSHLCLLCAAVHSPRDLSLKSCSYHMPLTNVPPTQRYPDKKGLIKNAVRFLWRSNPKYKRPNASLFLFISFLLILEPIDSRTGKQAFHLIISLYKNAELLKREADLPAWKERAVKRGLRTCGQTWGASRTGEGSQLTASKGRGTSVPWLQEISFCRPHEQA